jgi:hypothetical protein
MANTKSCICTSSTFQGTGGRHVVMPSFRVRDATLPGFAQLAKDVPTIRLPVYLLPKMLIRVYLSYLELKPCF